MASNYDLYSPYAIQAAQKYGVPTNLFLWQIGQESGWDPNATNSGSTASGIAQFIKSTAKSFGINPFDPVQSLDAAAKYDAQLFDKYGNWSDALKAYGTTASGTKIPSGLIPDRPDVPSTGNADIDATINNLLGMYSTRAPAELAGVGNQAELDEWNSSWGGAILRFEKWVGSGIQRVGIVVLGIVIVGLAVWGLLRRK